jgi:CHAT domain-containing protein
MLITPDADPVYVQIPEANRYTVLSTAQQLRDQISNPYRVGTTTYLPFAQKLYRWLIAPLEATLQEQGITNLGFIMDAGLRSLLVSALHNGEHFLIEDYSVAMIPSINLIDTTYVNVQNTQALVAGSSVFADQSSLPTVPLELGQISALWASDSPIENEDFTIENLIQARRSSPYGIIHLSTHGEFLSGSLDNSYIQFHDARLRLDQIRELGWNDPPVELVTLSACQTALGNRDAELGFAGLALLAGAKSALGSLWSVSDEATTGLMVEFYRQLQEVPLKSEALQQAQLAMLRGQVYVQDGELHWDENTSELPPILMDSGRQEFRHPFYWSSFTMVGSPW